MTPEQTTILRKVITDACPELMELSFGCKYSVGREGYIKIYTRSIPENNYYCGECREGKLYGQAFTNFRCGYCKKGFSWPNTGSPRYCNTCAKKHEVCYSCKRKVKIIGKPIELQHVLRTLESLKIEVAIDSDGNWKIYDCIGDCENGCSPDCQWLEESMLYDYDLTKSFEDQNDDLKLFLYNLLVKKV